MKTAVEHIEEQMLYKQLDYQEFAMLIWEAKKMEKQQMADAFYAPANEAESNNFDEYYTQKYKDEN